MTSVMSAIVSISEYIFSVGVYPLSSWVKIRLHAENQPPRLSGSALKVPGWWGGGGWVASYTDPPL